MHANEIDLEQAESSNHKRWMERQNAKLREKANEEEYAYGFRLLLTMLTREIQESLRERKRKKAEKQRKKEAGSYSHRKGKTAKRGRVKKSCRSCFKPQKKEGEESLAQRKDPFVHSFCTSGNKYIREKLFFNLVTKKVLRRKFS